MTRSEDVGWFLASIGVLCVAAGAAGWASSCSPAVRSEADAIAVVLTGAVCSPLDPLDANPWVQFGCVLAEQGEADVAAALEASTSTPAPAVHARRVVLAVPASQARSFAARHASTSDGGSDG